MPLTIRDLYPPPSRGERLLVQRKRKGHSQERAAQTYGVTRDIYQRWERDLDAGPSAGIAALRDYEVCMLLRRRYVGTELEMGKLVGLSRQWVSMIERGAAPPATLVDYWVEHAPRA